MKKIKREPQLLTVDECLDPENALPSKIELTGGELGPFSVSAKRFLLANWGANEVVRLIGRDVVQAVLDEAD